MDGQTVETEISEVKKQKIINTLKTIFTKDESQFMFRDINHLQTDKKEMQLNLINR